MHKISKSLHYQNEFDNSFIRTTFETEEDLLEIIKMDYSPFIYQDDNRDKYHKIESTDFYFFDVDNTDPEKQCSISDFFKIFNDYEFYLTTSKSHNKEKVSDSGKRYPPANRYHVLFPCVETITDSETIRRSIQVFCERYPFFDTSAGGTKRFFFGYEFAEVFSNGGERLHIEIEQKKESVSLGDFKPNLPPMDSGFEQFKPNHNDLIESLEKVYSMGGFGDYETWLMAGTALKNSGYSPDDFAKITDPGVDSLKKWNELPDGQIDSPLTEASLTYHIRKYIPEYRTPSIRTEAKKEAQETIKKGKSVPLDLPLPSSVWNKIHCKITLSKTGQEQIKPKSTIENITILLENYGVRIRENLMTHNIETFIPGFDVEGKSENASLATIQNLLIINDLPTLQIDQTLLAIAHKDRFHPVKDWIDSVDWDGVNRLPEFFKILTTDEKFSKTLKCVLMKKWALSAIACLYESEYKGRGVLTLQSKQYMGKTRFLESLSINKRWIKDGLTLDPKNKDSLEIAISHWICELGELEATFKRADNAVLKSFLTMTYDDIRFAYDRRKEKFPRRTVFCASINSRRFLTDETGSTRFWTIPLIAIDHNHNMDISQFWAQIKTIYQEKKASREDFIWWLSDAENALLELSNKHHGMRDEVEESLIGCYDVAIQDKNLLKHKSATEILKENFLATGKLNINRCAEVLREMGFREVTRRGKLGFLIPEKMNSSLIYSDISDDEENPLL